MVDSRIPVLVVDDDVMNRLVLKMHMGVDKFVITEAENGLIAFNYILEKPEIKHVLLDLNMPVMDGFSFIEQCNKNIPDRKLKIHVTSAYSERDFLVFVAERKINTDNVINFFSKPYPMGQLLKCLD